MEQERQGARHESGQSYWLHLPEVIPAGNFWSIVLYDIWMRSTLANGQKIAGKISYEQKIQIK